MKIITYNVNGIRAALKKGFLAWLAATEADVVCLQEVKATEKDFNLQDFKALGYEVYLYPAEKKGYSGTAIFTKITPKHVAYGCGIAAYDQEGRVIRADFDDLSVMSVYMPSGTSGEDRQTFKYKWLDEFYDYTQNLVKEYPSLVICGDYNICHKPIDIHNPKFTTEPHHYTWWSMRFPSIRERNLGWRIDYQGVTECLRPRLKRCVILPEAKHSDHAPVLLEID